MEQSWSRFGKVLVLLLRASGSWPQQQLELVIVCGCGALAPIEDIQDGEHGVNFHIWEEDDGVSAILGLS